MKYFGIITGLIVIIGSALAASIEHKSILTRTHSHQMNNSPKVSLKEAGHDQFGTVQEVIKQLNMQENVNWKNVDLELLRQHLLDMRDMSENVDVLAKHPIGNGVQIKVKAATSRALEALRRIFAAHPAQLAHETNWEMQVEEKEDHFLLTITSQNSNDTDKIRGLGYIGLMAWGNHHPSHHWAMATGQNPH